MAMKANLLKVKVYPKDLKSIPDILPFRDLIHGEPLELELDKKEIWRCMHFGDVFDMTSGEEVLIDRPAFEEIVEFVEEESTPEDETPVDPEQGENGEPADPEEPPVEGGESETEEPKVDEALVNEAKITE